MTDLNELLERVKAATGPDRELDRDICIALQYGGENSEGAANVRVDPEWGDDNDLIFEIGAEECCNPIPELTASIDAALALAERVLPGWEIALGTCGLNNCPWACLTEPEEPFRGFAADAPTMELAFIEALLQALTKERTNVQ